jgi:hypothetical protein
VSVAPASAAKRHPPRVAAGYYGVNYQRIHFDSAPVREQQLEAIAAIGAGQVRIPLSWIELERHGPGAYDFEKPDEHIAALARHGLRASPTFGAPPKWAVGISGAQELACELGNAATLRTDQPHAYAVSAGVLARRYGRKGSFWRHHPELPYLPVATWEIWNEPNMTAFWCPEPQPETYADMFVLAAEQIAAADWRAEVVIGGLALGSPSGTHMGVTEFLGRAARRQPEIWTRAAGVGVHVYPNGGLERQLLDVVGYREQFRAAGVPDTEPMYATEVGWNTRGLNAIPEGDRAQRYRVMARRLPNTSCNVAAMIPHTWTSTERDSGDYQHWHGIAHPRNGSPYESALEYRRAVRLMRGAVSRRPPRRLIEDCPDMPPIDRDGGGVPDNLDKHPTDPERGDGGGRRRR